MSECSLLQAALRHNPLFFLAAPNSLKKDVKIEKDGKPAAEAVSNGSASANDSETNAGQQSPAPSSQTEVEAPKVVTVRALSRQERKRRKIKALLDLCLCNDRNREDAKAAESGQVAPPPGKRSRLETPSAEETSQEVAAPVVEDYKEMRNAVRRKRRKMRVPEFQLSATGDHASLLMAAHSRTPIFMRDVQTLLLNAVVPDHAPWSTRWCNLVNADRVSRTLAVVVDGLSLRDLQAHAGLMQSTLTLFPHQTELISPAHYGTSVAEEILNVPLSMTQKHRLVKRVGSLDGAVQAGLIQRQWGDAAPAGAAALPQALPRPAAIGRTRLLLDISQLMDEGYPLPGAGQYSRPFRHFVPTKDKYRPVTDQSPMFAVDCEMCLTREGSELTSISVLDESEELVYGTLVRPDNAITDYLTRYSGITAERLQGVTTRLADVQRDLRDLLPADAILIGQSFNNDLRALQMMHPYIIDTSVIFNITGVRHRKTKLSLLSYMFLGETIQNDATGHDATEDALASLRLVQRKLTRGYTYGDAAQGGYVPAMNGAGPEPADDDEMPAAVNMDGYYTSLLSRMDEVGVTTAIVASGPGADIYRVACETTNHPSLTLQTVTSNRQACDQSCAAMSSADLTLCHMELRDRLHWSRPAEKVRAHVRQLDKRLRRLYRAAPPRALLALVCAGAGGQTGTVENGVCLTAVKPENAEDTGAATEMDDDTDTQS